MQLYARNNRQTIVSAKQASRQENYYCLECAGLVRARGGLQRQIHFYHVDPERPCRQHGKTLEHLQVQQFLNKILDKSALEVPFKEINRIADVVWYPQKIVFEVQCSPIAPDEIRARNADYGSLGYQVVWILHDSRYNRLRLSAAELSLRFIPHYFTNMDVEGKGCIYDQYDYLKRGQRKHRLEPLTVDLSKVKAKPVQWVDYPRLVQQRLSSWPFHFEGDLLDHIGKDYMFAAIDREKETKQNKNWRDWLKDIYYYVVVRPYKIGLQIMLERASR